MGIIKSSGGSDTERVGGGRAFGLARPVREATEFAVAQGEYGEFEGPARDQVVFGTYRATGSWSRPLVALIAERVLCAGPGTLLDVGANIGLVAIPVLARSAARCIAFEPAPDNAQCLQRNAERHGVADRIEVHAIALDARAGEASLALSPDNSGDHRLADGTDLGGRRSVPVRTARLDEVIAGRPLEPPVVMKVDTQGAEARVLRGAVETLAHVDVLVVEYWPAGLARMGDNTAALHAFLQSFPYGALLPQHAPPELGSTAALLHALDCLLERGAAAGEGFYDLVFARSPAWPSERAVTTRGCP
jgi:FkbM family methyltransferase